MQERQKLRLSRDGAAPSELHSHSTLVHLWCLCTFNILEFGAHCRISLA